MISKLSRITYGPTTKLAEALAISNGVVINPTVGFGKPVIANTGLTTFVVANQFHANRKNTALVASLFNITERDVKNAVRFESRLKQAA
jgi:uncharacterized protein (DUF433 family)